MAGKKASKCFLYVTCSQKELSFFSKVQVHLHSEALLLLSLCRLLNGCVMHMLPWQEAPQPRSGAQYGDCYLKACGVAARALEKLGRLDEAQESLLHGVNCVEVMHMAEP